MDAEIIGETTDPWGARVVLLARVWHEKVLPDHAELTPFKDDILHSVASAEHVEVDPVFAERRRFFNSNLGPVDK